jgi:ribosomal protein S8
VQTDPIADFLTRIRNGLHADRDEVEMPASNFKAEAEQQAYEELKEENPEAYETPAATDEESAEETEE